jgi:signal transduction histidine kinase
MDLLNNRFLKCFSEEGVRALIEKNEIVSFPDGTILFEEGDVSDFVYLLLRGEVQLSKHVQDRRVEIAIVSPDDYFGELGVIDGSVRSARAEAHGEIKVARIPAEDVKDVVLKEPAHVVLQLFGGILDYLRIANQRYAAESVRKEKLHLVGEMANTIVHDFRNPIAAIQMAAELVKRKHQDPATQEHCDIIVRQNDRMVVMVQELLDFAKGAPNLKLKRQTVAYFFQQFESLNKEFFEQNKVRLELNPIDAGIEIDLGRMLRAFQNLATNAVEAMQDQKDAKFTITAKEEGSSVIFCISDNGPGIPESIRENLFDPFVTHGKKNGTGLGTSIVKTMVGAHQGTISFETATGKGTTFQISLPRVRVNE